MRFERGFVDAARISADTWLAHGRTIRKRAPLLSALTVSGLRGRDIGGGGEGTARILADIDRLLADPQLRGLAALDLSGAAVEVEDDDHDYVSSLSPEVLPRLIASGLLPTLRGLDIGDVGADGLRALGACDLARLEVLRVGAWGSRMPRGSRYLRQAACPRCARSGSSAPTIRRFPSHRFWMRCRLAWSSWPSSQPERRS